MPPSYTENPQILKTNTSETKFSEGFSLLSYDDDLLLCSPSWDASSKDSLHLLKKLAKS